MIQRIQSVYLLLAAVCFGSQFTLPYLSTPANNPATTQPALADGVFNLFDNIGLLGLSAFGLILSVLAIFLYNNRPLQMKLVAVLTLVGALTLVLAGIATQTLRTHLPEGGSVEFGLAWIGPVVALLLSRLANSAIRKDEQLVKSMDRLR